MGTLKPPAAAPVALGILQGIQGFREQEPLSYPVETGGCNHATTPTPPLDPPLSSRPSASSAESLIMHKGLCMQLCAKHLGTEDEMGFGPQSLLQTRSVHLFRLLL